MISDSPEAGNAKQVMLDECITYGPAHAIIKYLSLLSLPIESHFLVDYMECQGLKDCNWAPRLTPPANWVVISSDTDSTRTFAKGPPLHVILPRIGITGFFLKGKSFSQVSGSEKARSIISVMPRVLELARESAAGTRFKISRPRQNFDVSEWPLGPKDFR